MMLTLREWSGSGDLWSGCGTGRETLRQQSTKLKTNRPVQNKRVSSPDMTYKY
jgi:hypothetical protein